MGRQFIDPERSMPLSLPVVGTKPRLGRRLGNATVIPAALHCAAETLPVAAAVPDLDADRLSRAFAALKPAARSFVAGTVSGE